MFVDFFSFCLESFKEFFFCMYFQNDLKIWDDSCTCRCKEIKDCTTGSYFDHNHCECIGVNIF